MKRKVKYKKMRELHEMYKGDSEHDNAPPTVDWEVEFEEERKKTLLREKKLAERIQAQKAFQAKRKEEDAKRSVNELKIRPNESLAQFSERVNNTTRLEASAKANAEKNRTRKAKLEEKRAKRRAERFSDDEEEDEKEDRKAGGARFSHKPLPRFLDVADRPPEFSITSSKKRFKEADNAGQEMSALSARVQALYKKKKPTKGEES